ncbi:hypothetical protein DID88_006255 [Monilinia fructigena]|uniref:Uncharacterized protein n=1 Tax=Monilinia fructigena TaxID=38457 RepID=A0A395J249_9HELO|nr:hypothetical protein DID88_006255 [Monilinia fructigena]
MVSMKKCVITLLALSTEALAKKKPVSTSATVASPASPTSSDYADVIAAQAIANTSSPNTNYETALADRIKLQNLFAEKGITLDKYLAVTHPSQPNYLAAVGGDYFGLDGDPFIEIPNNVSSIVDLLEDKGISWGLYQEDMPYTGYQGFEWRNQENGANAYVRKT